MQQEQLISTHCDTSSGRVAILGPKLAGEGMKHAALLPRLATRAATWAAGGMHLASCNLCSSSHCCAARLSVTQLSSLSTEMSSEAAFWQSTIHGSRANLANVPCSITSDTQG